MNYMTSEVGKKADELVAACIMNSETRCNASCPAHMKHGRGSRS